MTEVFNFPKEVRSFFLYFGNIPNNEKIVIGISPEEHLTIHFGTKSKIFDIHLKNNITGEYKTLIKVRHFVLWRILLKANWIHQYGMSQYWPLKRTNLGWFKRRDCFFFKNDPDLMDVNKLISRRSNKLKIGKSIAVKEINDFWIDPKESVTSKCDSFWVTKYRKGHLINLGIAFFKENEIRGKSIYYLSKKRLNKFNKMGSIGLFNILQQHDFENKEYVLSSLYNRLIKIYPPK